MPSEVGFLGPESGRAMPSVVSSGSGAEWCRARAGRSAKKTTREPGKILKTLNSWSGTLLWSKEKRRWVKR